MELGNDSNQLQLEVLLSFVFHHPSGTSQFQKPKRAYASGKVPTHFMAIYFYFK